MPDRETPRAICLKDYTAPAYEVASLDLHFTLEPASTRVRATMALTARGPGAPLVLNGVDVDLKHIRLDGETLDPQRYDVNAEQLVVHDLPATATLEIETEINPQANTSLEGLYLSDGMFCTQCEAEGFRKITYFLDRPDVMTRYTTTIVADKARYPVLLSNGNPVERGELDGGRHWVKWEDPFKKPSYLFALVAGDLKCVADRFTTRSGREVKLELYVEPENIDKCGHALESLKKAMAWDEQTFGLEYDLDIYMIVAVSHFNMGAMENKGLNVFNDACVLAKPETATDSDYLGIQGVIGHEYFHNWTGNRVTCRDWFQLSLKEGLTVFRDQLFTADMYSPTVKRISDVNILRTAQFSQDAGPMAHPVRPESYIDISNFYTVTVYNKGAEVIRMMYNLLGREGFRQGMDLYFQRHDGRAVTTDDFVAAMEDANGADLGQFRLWYSQAGTPEVSVERAYDPQAQTYSLTLRQSCPATPGQPDKQPFHIPVAVGLMGPDGEQMPLQLEGEEGVPRGETQMLQLREAEQRFTFVNVAAEPTPSLLRGFSAPVKLKLALDDAELMFLMAHDTDEFNRWEAAQQLSVRIINGFIDQGIGNKGAELDDGFIAAYRKLLQNRELDKALVAQALTLPNEHYLAEGREVVDPVAIHEAREAVVLGLAQALKPDLLTLYDENRSDASYAFETAAVGRRSLKNTCLHYLTLLPEADACDLAFQQFQTADNMTDSLAALSALASVDCPERTQALERFYDQWRHDHLVIDKWFALQSTSRLAGTIDRVEALLQHGDFDLTNPNKVRAVLGAFAFSNPAQFHDAAGRGYRLIGDHVIELNRINPQMAARLASAFSRWRRYDGQRQDLMRAQLERIQGTEGLAKDVYEIVSKSLA